MKAPVLTGRRGAAIKATREIERVKYHDTATDDDDGRDIISSDEETEATTADDDDTDAAVQLAIDSSVAESESDAEVDDDERRVAPSARNSCKPSEAARKRDRSSTSTESDEEDHRADKREPDSAARQRRSASRRAAPSSQPVERRASAAGGDGKRKKRQRKRASNRQPLTMTRSPSGSISPCKVGHSELFIELCADAAVDRGDSARRVAVVAAAVGHVQVDGAVAAVARALAAPLSARGRRRRQGEPVLERRAALPPSHAAVDEQRHAGSARECFRATVIVQVTPVARSVAVEEPKDCPPPLSPNFGAGEETVAKVRLAIVVRTTAVCRTRWPRST